jgi:hypothetical protein
MNYCPGLLKSYVEEGRGKRDMEKSLPATALYRKDGQHQPVLEQHSTVTGGYDTRLLPQISLPQHRQTANAEKHSGLLGFALQRSTQRSIESCEAAGLTMALNKHEIAQSLIEAQQVQSAPTLTSISATFANTSKHPYIQDQDHTAQLLQGSMIPEYTGQLVMSSPNKHHSYEEWEIARMRVQILIKTFVTLTLFVAGGGVIWVFLAHTAIYLLVMFVVLAIMLGSILSKFIGDYYQLTMHEVRPTPHLQSVKTVGNTDALQGGCEPHTKSDTSGYLDALKDTFREDRHTGTTDQPLQ